MAPLSELASVVAPPTQTNMNDWKEVLLVLPKNAATTESGVGMVEQQQKAGGVVINNNISKRRSNDDLPEEEEDVIEVRRQCRMMKNRESAAQSCAKRLAYTAKLEKELDSLKEENKKLKQIVNPFEELETAEEFGAVVVAILVDLEDEGLREVEVEVEVGRFGSLDLRETVDIVGTDAAEDMTRKIQ
ncbi:hypothetical protein LWI29_016186 [Acer saccharum]|uniref:BZIP domain-containing protein n=1 Tax=Acer saccharum TaxID=4024 RepID=A0AA39TET9_ACESA|nr:hypothetical protein LWI29_016186 [Acer saccharum]